MEIALTARKFIATGLAPEQRATGCIDLEGEHMSQNTWKSWIALSHTPATVALAGMPIVNMLRGMVQRWGLVAGLLLSLSVCAEGTGATLPSGGDTWTEEVLLHDGRTLFAERYVKRGGRAEIGQAGAYVEQQLRFTEPSTGKTYTWSDTRSPGASMANFLLLALHVVDGVPYVVADPMGCQSYNTWGRPNPPYVIFRAQGNAWQRIALVDLPDVARTANVLHSAPDDWVRRHGTHNVTAAQIREENASNQPQYREILREAMTQEQIASMCDELVIYKGHWIDPRNPFARKYIDEKQK